MWKKLGGGVTSFYDEFKATGFTYGANLCSGSPAPQRSYTLVLSQKSVILMSLIMSKTGNGAFAGIGTGNKLCGYDFSPSGSYTTASTSCSFIAEKGPNVFSFCSADSDIALDGSIIIIPSE